MRLAAVAGLAGMGVRAGLNRLQKDRDERVRAAGAKALEAIGPPDDAR